MGVREEVVGRRHADRSRRGVASSRRESARKRVEREFLLGTMMQWVLSALTQLQQPAALQTGLRLVDIVVSVWSSRADRVEVGLEEDDTVRIVRPGTHPCTRELTSLALESAEGGVVKEHVGGVESRFVVRPSSPRRTA